MINKCQTIHLPTATELQQKKHDYFSYPKAKSHKFPFASMNIPLQSIRNTCSFFVQNFSALPNIYFDAFHLLYHQIIQTAHSNDAQIFKLYAHHF